MSKLSDFIVIGDIYIIEESQSVQTDSNLSKPQQSIPHAIKRINTFKDKLKEDVTRIIPSGAVHRPTAGELLAKDEPEIKKQTEEALAETLAEIPELKKAKEILEAQKI